MSYKSQSSTNIFAHVRAVWRYRWSAIVLTSLLCVFGWLFVHNMKNSYQAEAQVYIDSKSVLGPILKGVGSDIRQANEVKMLALTLLSRTNIEIIAEKSNLLKKDKGELYKELFLSRLANQIKLVQDTKGSKSANIFSISYFHENPKQAYTVVRTTLAQLESKILNHGGIHKGAAQSFLMRQVNEYEQRLKYAEKKIKEFKFKHSDIITDKGNVIYHNKLEQARNDLEENALALSEVKKHHELLLKQLSAESKLIGSHNNKNPLLTRIRIQNEKLDELKLLFTNEHPDIISLRQSIADLEHQLKSQPNNKAIKSSNNPIYQDLKTTLNKVEAKISGLALRAVEYRKKIKHFLGLLSLMPEIETEFLNLTRGYNVVKDRYDQLLQGLESARVAEEISTSSNTIKFDIITPPLIPLLPSSPNRPRLNVFVILIALTLGIAFAFVLSYMRPIFENYYSLKQHTGIPIVGSVSLQKDNAWYIRHYLELAFFLLCSMGLMTVLIYLNY